MLVYQQVSINLKEIISSIFTDHSGRKLEITRKLEKNHKYVETKHATKQTGSMKKIKKYLKRNEKENIPKSTGGSKSSSRKEV